MSKIVNESDLGKPESKRQIDKAMPFIPAEDALGSLVEPLNSIVGLSLDEMKSNVEAARKKFESIEKKLNAVRQAKLEAVEAGANEKVFSLSKEDADLSLKLDTAYQIWQTAKRNYEGALLDAENKIVAQGLLADYNKTSIDQRAEKGNVFLNHVRQLNDLISLVEGMASEFEVVQQRGMIDMEMLCNKLKSINIYRIEDSNGNIVELPVIKNDAYGSIRPIREVLGKEGILLESNLSLLEKTVLKIRKACNFHLLSRGD